MTSSNTNVSAHTCTTYMDQRSRLALPKLQLLQYAEVNDMHMAIVFSVAHLGGVSLAECQLLGSIAGSELLVAHGCAA